MEPEHSPVHRAKSGRLTISCKCRALLNKHGRNRDDYYEPIDWPSGISWQQVFNDPTNHNGIFTEQDRVYG